MNPVDDFWLYKKWKEENKKIEEIERGNIDKTAQYVVTMLIVFISFIYILLYFVGVFE